MRVFSSSSVMRGRGFGRWGWLGRRGSGRLWIFVVNVLISEEGSCGVREDGYKCQFL